MLALGTSGLQLSGHALLLTASAVAAVLLFGVTVRYRSQQIARPVALLFASAVVWSAAVAARVAVGDHSTASLWLDLRVAAAAPAGVLYLWVVLEYLDRDALLRLRRLAALFVVPLVTLLLVATGERTELVVQSVETVQYVDPLSGAAYQVLEPSYGPWFYFNAIYNYLLIALAVGLLGHSLLGRVSAETYRVQTSLLLLAIVLPLLVNVGYHVGLLAVDLTAASFVVGLGLFSAAIFRYELFRLGPTARDTAVENMDEGFFVLDRDDQIVDLNPAAATMVGESASALLDSHVRDIFPQYDQLVEEHGRTAEFSSEVAFETDGESAHYDVTASPIQDARDRYLGRVVLVQDVTERVHAKERFEERTAELTTRTQELERQNERLEEFASVLSHDLRNPLSVAEAYLERARTTGDEDDFDAIEEGLTQIDRLIDDLLTMARQGQTVQDRQQLNLRTVSNEAWEHVETDTTTLTVATDARLSADRTRLLQVFENLFRNAVEHGSSPASQAQVNSVERESSDSPLGATADADITVTVGGLSDGFYVEDDGPGIPAEERDSVFERGFTTDADGTGLGLSIVKLAVEAHGWSVDVTESSTGGARFEIHDVQSLVENESAAAGLASQVREDLT